MDSKTESEFHLKFLSSRIINKHYPLQLLMFQLLMVMYSAQSNLSLFNIFFITSSLGP